MATGDPICSLCGKPWPCGCPSKIQEAEKQAICPPGTKYDNDKIRWELLPYKELGEIAKVFTLGAKKYADFNWVHVKPFRSRYFGALMRHITAWYEGETKDPETNCSHLAHAGCCLLFLMWGDNNQDIVK
jgi:hypothetical protein